MKVLHTSDWHIGRIFHNVSLLDDQAHALEQLVDLARDSRAQALIVAGDVYDRAVPPADAVRLLDETLRVAARCTFSLDELRYAYPDDVTPDGLTPHAYLRRLTEQGIERRWPAGCPQAVRAQVEHELALMRLANEVTLTAYKAAYLALEEGMFLGNSAGAAIKGVLQLQEHFGDKPFFVNFPFGYVAAGVDWYEAAGIPFAAYDDFGRENAYPLVRVEATTDGQPPTPAGNNVVATVDTVLPISGEASCRNCHADPMDNNFGGSRTGQPTQALIDAGLPVVDSNEDPLFDAGGPMGKVPTDVAIESRDWAG